MLIAPVKINAREYALYVILGKDGLDRIEQYDPAVIKIGDMGEPWRSLRLREVAITFATADEMQKVMKASYNGDLGAGLKLVTRGFRFRPDLGDYDGPPMSVKKDSGETKQ